MLLPIIDPTHAYNIRMMHSYNNFIFTFNSLQRVRKCAQKLLHIHFYFPDLFLNITPIYLQILILNSYKLLSCSYIYVFKNEAKNLKYNENKTADKL